MRHRHPTRHIFNLSIEAESYNVCTRLAAEESYFSMKKEREIIQFIILMEQI